MKRFSVTLSLIFCLIASVSAAVAFHGRSGRGLRDAVAAACRVESPVPDVQQWMTTVLADSRGMLYLPLDHEYVRVRPAWPDDMLPLGVVPVEWWRFDSRYESMPGDTLQADLVNFIPARFDDAKLKDSYPPADLTRLKWTNGIWSTGFLMVDGIETNGWTPPQDYRGDIARIVLYMLTIYPSGMLDPWSLLIADGSLWPSLTPYGIELLMRWSREDPVDAREHTRNSIIASAQGAYGNPFVRWPGLEQYIWGDKAGDIWLDPDASGNGGDGGGDDARLPLRSVYHLSDQRIDLWSPIVPDDASWTVNGTSAKGHVVPADIGVGRHEFAYTHPSGERGRVIITIVQ